MSKQTINIGASPNDGTGTPLRTSFDYCNLNFTELYTALGGGVGLPGATTQVIFNDGGTNLAGDSGLTFNKTTDTLSTARITASGDAIVCSSTGDFYVGTTISPQFKVERATGNATITGAATVGTTLGVTGNLTVQTNKLAVTTTGVGCGTATPSNQLHVKSTSSTPALIETSGGALTYLQFTSTTGSAYIGNNANGLGFYTTGSADLRMSLAAAGDLSITSGNVVMGTANKGIDFSINSEATGMTSELLNDYEEGTWTPVFQGTTTNGTYVYSTQVGRYTKVGNLVTVFGHLVISSITTAATGVMRIGGLPFTTSSANVYAAATVGWVDLITISSGTLALSVNTAGVVIDMYRILSAAGVGFISPSDLVVNTRINFTATYFV